MNFGLASGRSVWAAWSALGQPWATTRYIVYRQNSPPSTLPPTQDHRSTLLHYLGLSSLLRVANERDRGRGSLVGGPLKCFDKLEAHLHKHGVQPCSAPCLWNLILNFTELTIALKQQRGRLFWPHLPRGTSELLPQSRPGWHTCEHSQRASSQPSVQPQRPLLLSQAWIAMYCHRENITEFTYITKMTYHPLLTPSQLLG